MYHQLEYLPFVDLGRERLRGAGACRSSRLPRFGGKLGRSNWRKNSGIRSRGQFPGWPLAPLAERAGSFPRARNAPASYRAAA